jgi:hypothetical protein
LGKVEANSEGIPHELGDDQVSSNRQSGLDGN